MGEVMPPKALITVSAVYGRDILNSILAIPRVTPIIPGLRSTFLTRAAPFSPGERKAMPTDQLKTTFDIR